MKHDEQVYRWMTPCPQTIEREASIADARARMRQHGIRHLPVLDAGELVGVVSEHDLSFAERFVDARQTAVGDVMTKEPFLAVPYAPLCEVADEMAKHKYGTAIVVDGGNVVGVFTATDALRVIAHG